MSKNNISKQEKILNFIRKGVKPVAIFFFAIGNAFLIYNYLTSYEEGRKRGQLYVKNNKHKFDEKNPTFVPQQMRPQYIETQVRKYKRIVNKQKKSERSKDIV